MDVEAILRGSRTIAVLGARNRQSAAGHYVPAYLHAHGYRVFPVNPGSVGQTWWGEPVRATLAEIPTAVDLVDVFRRAEAIPSHVEDILAMRPLPRVVWFQLGIVNDDAARLLEARGIQVVQNRCTLADHRALGLG